MQEDTPQETVFSIICLQVTEAAGERERAGLSTDNTKAECCSAGLYIPF